MEHKYGICFKPLSGNLGYVTVFYQYKYSCTKEFKPLSGNLGYVTPGDVFVIDKQVLENKIGPVSGTISSWSSNMPNILRHDGGGKFTAIAASDIPVTITITMSNGDRHTVFGKVWQVQD